MIKHISLFLLSFFLVLTNCQTLLYAEDNSEGIVVWRLEKKSGVSDDDIDSISGMITSEVERFSKRSVVSEADIQTIIKGEVTKQKCGMDDTSCLAEIGNALGVPEAVSGDLGRVGGIWVLNLRRIQVQTAEVISRSTRQMEGDIDDLMLVITGAVAVLFGKKAPPMRGILSVKTVPEGAIVKENSRELGVSPFKKRLDPGDYTLNIHLEDHLDATQNTTVKSGEKTSMTVRLIKIPMNPYKLYGHVTFWSGLGLVALGGTFTGLAASKMSEHNSKIDTGDFKAAQDARDTSKTYGGVAIAGYAVGGALMITGVVLWILSPGDEAWAKEHMLSAGPTENAQLMLSYSGRF